MSETRDDPFFIGWLPVPPTYHRFLLPVVASLFVMTACGAAMIAWCQGDPGTGRWDTEERTFDGLLYTHPYPMIRVAGDPPRTLLLVEVGKFGARPRAERFAAEGQGTSVRATGTLLHRDGLWMLELAEGEAGLRLLSEDMGRLGALNRADVGGESVTLDGEVIDPKCHLGAMRPGGGKPHKACAMLCVAGGVPPMLVTRGRDGRERFYLLTTRDGEPANDEMLPFVGDQVTVSGRMEQRGGLEWLRVRQVWRR